MNIRLCGPADLTALLDIFHAAVHTSCTRDYTPAQLEAWAPSEPDRGAWAEKLGRETVLAAEEDGTLLGFVSLDEAYLDLLYVYPTRQRRGVAGILCDFAERLCPGQRIQVHASLTARPFFEGRGYRLLEQRQVERRGERLTNFLMEKELMEWT